MIKVSFPTENIILKMTEKQLKTVLSERAKYFVGTNVKSDNGVYVNIKKVEYFEVLDD